MLRNLKARIRVWMRYRGPVRNAVNCLNEAQALRSAGHRYEALSAARAGLAHLGDPAVQRRRPVEATALIGLTIAVEELARELSAPGAATRDVADTLAVLRGMSAAVERFPDLAAREPESAREQRLLWIPYLEKRLEGT